MAALAVLAVPAAPIPHPTIALLQTSSLASVVQGELERMIVEGDLQPGEKLTEVALAARLGVSRGPLREAFRMLEEAGLVRTEKNRGVTVRSLPVEEAVEIFDLRASMEELVGRRLAQRIGPAALKELRKHVDLMEQAVKARDAHGYHLLNLGFHDRLVELAGNNKLTAIYRKLIKELSLFRRLNLAETRQGDAGPSQVSGFPSGGGRRDAAALGLSVMPASVAEHRQIVKAIASGDAELAGRTLFEHVMQSKERTVKNHSPGVMPPVGGAAQRQERTRR